MFPDKCTKLRFELRRRHLAYHELNKHVEALALDGVFHPNGCRFGHSLVLDDGRLDVGRVDVVPANDHRVVDPSHDPEVAIFVPSCAVAGEVVPRDGEVRVLETLLVAPNAPQGTGPRALDRQKALSLSVDLLARLVQQHGIDPKVRQRSRSRLEIPPFDGKWRDNLRPALGLPKVVHDGAPSAADDVVAPAPHFWVCRLSGDGEQFERGSGGLRDVVVPTSHERPQCCRRCVQVAHGVFVHDVPDPGRCGVAWNAFEDDLLGGVQERPVARVGVPDDPTKICGTEVDVFGAHRSVHCKGVPE
mmetsp:Transcript_27657/g.80844  ORF Transcript_27657/g.80844 Transcript_27657/m.80844 type:complete len:303 (-) Transcript_27657:1020-1928(-)